jgi:hypothetical protein
MACWLKTRRARLREFAEPGDWHQISLFERKAA